MIPATASRSPVSALDSTSKPPLAHHLQRPSFTRSDAGILGSSASKIYDLDNPTHVAMKQRNDQLAASTGPLLRALKDATGHRGSCIFHFGGPGGQRAMMVGTSANHSVHFNRPNGPTVSIKNGEISHIRGNITPMTLNSNLSFFVAALKAPDAAENFRKNG